jgi:hypothetical protein
MRTRLGLTALDDNIPPAADNRRLVGIVRHRHQSNLVDEVDAEKIVRLLLQNPRLTVKRPSRKVSVAEYLGRSIMTGVASKHNCQAESTPSVRARFDATPCPRTPSL